jgi:CCR4-NOT transcription complex subunit 3
MTHLREMMRSGDLGIFVEKPEPGDGALTIKKPGAPASPTPPMFMPVEVSTPEVPEKADMRPEELAYQLFTASGIVPDVPYEISEYKPQNPVDAPVCYPHMPNMKLLQAEFFGKYDVSTLFYIFFYFPGSPQQYYAGRELRQREWRYHTKYQTWFRRIGDPTETTETYEIGRFHYFDKRQSENWCVRQRNDFKFEYEFLETD